MSVRTCSLSTLPIAARGRVSPVAAVAAVPTLPEGWILIARRNQRVAPLRRPSRMQSDPRLSCSAAQHWSLLCNGLCCIRRCVCNQRQTGADMMFIHRAICLAGTAVYSLHKSSTR